MAAHGQEFLQAGRSDLFDDVMPYPSIQRMFARD
jgi:hypothetical protein